MSNLIIVESPAKVKTIKKFLGNDYTVTASVGHVVDLPVKKLGIDEEHDYTPQYEVMDDKKAVVKSLKELASKADTVYLAPDPDREGEAIAYHISTLIKDKAKDIKRITFNEITKPAVLNAISHPREIDYDLFHAQQARRVLDRLIGYKLSPLLWKSIRFGVSAGRVQSVALRLVIERELQREAFIPEEYWNLSAQLDTGHDASIKVDLYKVDDKKVTIHNAQEADAIETAIKGKDWSVTLVTTKDRFKHPAPPFTTSTLQQVASQKLGYSAKHTMATAQKLYEGLSLGDLGTRALITYMRTDSVRMSDEAKAAIKSYITTTLGTNYYKNNHYKTKKDAQDAHEGIRPVDVTITPERVKDHLTSDQYHLYRLIWCRAVCSQMTDAVYQDTVITVQCDHTTWRAKGAILTFLGYLAVWPYRDEDTVLPKVAVGDSLKFLLLNKEQKYTQPPARYSEATLVKELETLEIGRPSTYATIMSTLQTRKYVEKVDGKLVPTELGRTVVFQLLQFFSKLMNVHFTAETEAYLDKIAEGTLDWITLVKEFASDFDPLLALAKTGLKSVRSETTDIPCPTCGKPLAIKFGSRGSFLACTGYPDCKYTSNFTRDDHGKITLVEKEIDAPVVMGTCPECGSDLIMRKSRYGDNFVACSAYPKCKYVKNNDTGVQCPQCKRGTLIEKKTKKRQSFYACSRYPACEYTTWKLGYEGRK